MSFNEISLYKPIFYQNWKSETLYNLAIWKNGLAFKKINFNKRGKPVIKIAELKNGITSQTKFTNQIFDNGYFLKKGDMVLSWSGNPKTSIDVFWYRLPDGWLNQHIFKVKVKNELNKNYFYFLLKYLKPNFIEIAKNKQTIGLGHVTLEDLKRIIVRIPKIEEQKLIASILSSLDDKIELNNQIKKNLEQIAQEIFKHWFVDFEFPNENGEPYKSSSDEMVENKIGQIPKEWKIEKLKKIIRFVKGKKPKIILKEKSDKLSKYLTINVLSGKDYLYAQPKGVILTEKENILMVMDGASSGKIYFGVNGIVASTIAKVEILNNNFSTEYIYHFLKYHENEINNHTSGSAIPHTDKNFVLSLRIALPDANNIIFSKFNKTIESIENKIIQNNDENKRLAKIRDALLPKLMSGEVRII